LTTPTRARAPPKRDEPERRGHHPRLEPKSAAALAPRLAAEGPNRGRFESIRHIRRVLVARSNRLGGPGRRKSNPGPLDELRAEARSGDAARRGHLLRSILLRLVDLWCDRCCVAIASELSRSAPDPECLRGGPTGVVCPAAGRSRRVRTAPPGARASERKKAPRRRGGPIDRPTGVENA